MPPDPLILGFDTSAAHCAAALYSGDRLIAEACIQMSRGQSETLMPMLEQVLSDGAASWHDLDAIGVGVGPGNFTGIRISVAAARGLALALGIPAIGVSSFEALSFGLPKGPILASVDARQGRAQVQLLVPDDAALPPELIDPAAPPERFSRPELTVVGFQAQFIATQLHARAVTAAHPIQRAIAMFAGSRRDTEISRPAPIYIRPTDAAPPRDAPPVILQ